MSGFGKNVGDLDQKAFQATIMDLINRGKLGVDSEDDTEFTKTTFLTVKSTDGLERYEKGLVNSYLIKRVKEEFPNHSVDGEEESLKEFKLLVEAMGTEQQ